MYYMFSFVGIIVGELSLLRCSNFTLNADQIMSRVRKKNWYKNGWKTVCRLLWIQTFLQYVPSDRHISQKRCGCNFNDSSLQNSGFSNGR